MDGRAVVAVRTNIHLLNADIFEKVTKAAGELTDKAPRGGLRVAAPKKHHIGVLDGVFDDISGRVHDALGPLAPDMLGAPIPPFPTVGVAHLEGKATEIFKKDTGMAMRSVDSFALTMPVTLHEDGVVAVLFMHSSYLSGNDSRGLVPGDSFEFTFAAIMRVAFSIWIPIHPFHWEGHSIWRINPLFITK